MRVVRTTLMGRGLESYRKEFVSAGVGNFFKKLNMSATANEALYLYSTPTFGTI